MARQEVYAQALKNVSFRFIICIGSEEFKKSSQQQFASRENGLNETPEVANSKVKPDISSLTSLGHTSNSGWGS